MYRVMSSCTRPLTAIAKSNLGIIIHDTRHARPEVLALFDAWHELQGLAVIFHG